MICTAIMKELNDQQHDQGNKKNPSNTQSFLLHELTTNEISKEMNSLVCSQFSIPFMVIVT